MPNWDNDVNKVSIYSFFTYWVKRMEFRLKELRKKKGLSQVRLAIDLCIPQNSISRFENGVRMPDYFTLIQIADYFNVSIDYLVGRSNNPSIK